MRSPITLGKTQITHLALPDNANYAVCYYPWENADFTLALSDNAFYEVSYYPWENADYTVGIARQCQLCSLLLPFGKRRLHIWHCLTMPIMQSAITLGKTQIAHLALFDNANYAVSYYPWENADCIFGIV